MSCSAGMSGLLSQCSPPASTAPIQARAVAGASGEPLPGGMPGSTRWAKAWRSRSRIAAACSSAGATRLQRGVRVGLLCDAS